MYPQNSFLVAIFKFVFVFCGNCLKRCASECHTVNLDIWEALLVNKLFEKGDLWVFKLAVAPSIFSIELIAHLDIIFEGVVAAAVDWGILREMIERVQF